MHSRLKIFFSAIFLTTLLPYIPFILPFIPAQLLGLSITGWAWMILLVITLLNLFRTKSIEFPVVFWLPWIIYLSFYLVVDYSFLGLQLTLQYILPILIGIVASGFTYTGEDLEWIFKRFMWLCNSILIMSLSGIILFGYGPFMAATPMLFSILVSILGGLWFIKRDLKWLLYLCLFFIIPVLQTTRMGIAAMAAIIFLHFANQSFRDRILFGGIGILIFILIFNSRSFQEKTFSGGHGTLNDLTLNYYKNSSIRTNGRISWKKALEPGLKASPVWGNGPRADNEYLTKITRTRGAEAHNDYLSVRFNYGLAGLALLLWGILATFVSLYQVSGKYGENGYIWLISTSTLSLFICFSMFMYTDNILKYTIFFPNYFFALIGIVYSLRKDEDLSGYSAI